MRMNTSSEQMESWLRDADRSRADSCFPWLLGHLDTGLIDGSGPLATALRCEERTHIGLLADNPAMCKAVEQAALTMQGAVSHGHRPDDIRLVQNVAAMLYVLRLGFGEADAPSQTLDALDGALDGAIRQAMLLARDQVDAFCDYICDIGRFLTGLALGNSRFIVLEMPTGNSLAVKLLTPLLENAGCVETVRVALSRNDSKRAGITRGQLLEEQLTDSALGRNDVLVYVDEWETGANFYAVCRLLRRMLPDDSFLFPGAFLSENASASPRYTSFCENHDRLLSRWGVRGSRFRKTLPALPSTLDGGSFFWSEHDRTAGYRKMQLHGSIVSSMDETIELLHENAVERQMAAQIILGELASERDLPGTPSQGVAATMKLFEDSYRDYLLCRDEFRQCADEYAKGGQTEDFDASMEPILQRYDRVLGNRKADLAICMASAHMGRVGSLDPVDRYHFREHAPVLIALDGPAARMHETVMQVLNARIKAATD